MWRKNQHLDNLDIAKIKMMEWLISKIENPEPALTKLSIGFWKRNIISDVPVLSSHATQCFSWQLNHCNSFVIGHFRTDGSDGCMFLLVPKSCGTLMEKYLLYEEITLPKHFLLILCRWWHHSIPVLQVLIDQSFPKAPGTVAELFEWPEYSTTRKFWCSKTQLLQSASWN